MSDSPVDIDDYEFVAEPGTTSNLASLFGSAMTIPEDVSLNYRAPVQPSRKPKKQQPSESQTKADLLFTAVAEAWSLSNDRWTDHGKIGVAISSFQDVKTIILYRTQADVLTRTVLKSLVVETKAKGYYTFVNGEDNVKYVILCKNRELREAIQQAGGIIVPRKKREDKENIETANKSVELEKVEEMHRTDDTVDEAKVEAEAEVEIKAEVEVKTEVEVKDKSDVEDEPKVEDEDKVEETEVKTKVKTEEFEDSYALKVSIDGLHAKLDRLLEDKKDLCENCKICKFTQDYERQLDESDGEIDFYLFVSNRIYQEVMDNVQLAKQKYELKIDGKGSKLLDRILKECLAKRRQTQKLKEK